MEVPRGAIYASARPDVGEGAQVLDRDDAAQARDATKFGYSFLQRTATDLKASACFANSPCSAAVISARCGPSADLQCSRLRHSKLRQLFTPESPRQS